jgi:hypothetical protein
VRNIDSWVGFYFAVAITSNAQDQLDHHVRTENDGFRDGGEPGAVAADSRTIGISVTSNTAVAGTSS